MELLEGADKPVEAPQVNAGLGLVEDGQARVAREHRGDLDALELAAGEALIHVSHKVVARAQAHGAQILIALLGRNLLARGELEELANLHALETGRCLETIADAHASALVDGSCGDVLALKVDAARRGLLDAHDEACERGLTAAVGAGDDRDFAGFDVQRQVVDDAPAGNGLSCGVDARRCLKRDVLECEHRSSFSLILPIPPAARGRRS